MSPHGVEAMLSHKLEDGSEKTIAYASHSFAPAEKCYTPVDKEALVIIFGVKVSLIPLGRKFIIVSDHKPFQYLFNEDKPIPILASNRIKR